jgi:hypothetical protein
MFSHTVSRSVLGTLLVAVLLVPAAQADDWARDKYAAVDPAIAVAIHDRASLTPHPAALGSDSSITRPDDRAGLRGVGSLPQPEPAGNAGFDWNVVTVGASVTFAALLLAFGSLIAVRHGRARVTSA